MTNSGHFARSSWVLTLTAISGFVAALYLAKGLLVPLALAVLLSFLLVPLCGRFERLRLGRIVSVLLSVTVALLGFGVVIWIVTLQLASLAPKLPKYEEILQARFGGFQNRITQVLSEITNAGQPREEIVGPTPEHPSGEAGRSERSEPVRLMPSPSSLLRILGGMFGSALGVLGTIGVVIVLVVFFLLRREDLRDRFIRLMGKGQAIITSQALEDATSRVSRYLAMQFLVNSTFGATVALGLYVIGIPGAVLWGMLAGIMRFIPYIGPWIAASMPILLSLAISAGWLTPILTVGLFVVLELLSNNVMEPYLYGRRTGISPVAVLLAAVFWTWLWGAAGLLLATPLTVCLLVIGKHVPQFSFLNTVLGDEPVFDPKSRLYQRLLAGDQEEAAELIEDSLDQMTAIEVYDRLVIPTIAMVEAHRSELDDRRYRLILQSLKVIVEDIGLHLQEARGTDQMKKPVTSDPPVVAILCVPAHDEADEIVSFMLSQLVDERCSVTAISATVLTGELMETIEQTRPDVVCVSAMPPSAALHARYLCKRIRCRFPQTQMIVGLWHARGDLDRIKNRLACTADTHVVRTLAAALDQVQALVKPLIASKPFA